MRTFQSIDIAGVRYEYGLGLFRFDVLGRMGKVHSKVARFYEETTAYELDAWTEWCGGFASGEHLRVSVGRGISQGRPHADLLRGEISAASLPNEAQG